MKNGKILLSSMKNQTIPLESSIMYGVEGKVPTVAVETAIMYAVAKGIQIGTWLAETTN